MTEGRRRASHKTRGMVDRALDIQLVNEALEIFVGVLLFGGRLQRRLLLNVAIRGGDRDGDVKRMTGALRHVTGDDVRRRRGVDISSMNRKQQYG